MLQIKARLKRLMKHSGLGVHNRKMQKYSQGDLLGQTFSIAGPYKFSIAVPYHVLLSKCLCGQSSVMTCDQTYSVVEMQSAVSLLQCS